MGALNLEQIIRKPEILWLQSLHKAQTEQIYLNMRRALDSAHRGRRSARNKARKALEAIEST